MSQRTAQTLGRERGRAAKGALASAPPPRRDPPPPRRCEPGRAVGRHQRVPPLRLRAASRPGRRDRRHRPDADEASRWIFAVWDDTGAIASIALCMRAPPTASRSPGASLGLVYLAIRSRSVHTFAELVGANVVAGVAIPRWPCSGWEKVMRLDPGRSSSGCSPGASLSTSPAWSWRWPRTAGGRRRPRRVPGGAGGRLGRRAPVGARHRRRGSWPPPSTGGGAGVEAP